jgi:hypothetical protein
LDSLCSPGSERKFIIAIAELQKKTQRKRERNCEGRVLSDALSGSGELIATTLLSQVGFYSFQYIHVRRGLQVIVGGIVMLFT